MLLLLAMTAKPRTTLQVRCVDLCHLAHSACGTAVKMILVDLTRISYSHLSTLLHERVGADSDTFGKHHGVHRWFVWHTLVSFVIAHSIT